jgi:hypothetical protein
MIHVFRAGSIVDINKYEIYKQQKKAAGNYAVEKKQQA